MSIDGHMHGADVVKRILVICTGNSCRSQMAEGWLRSFGDDIEVCSAGTRPASRVSHRAVEVMEEAGIDISDQFPKSVDRFLDQAFDYVVTVCDDANEQCPVFTGKVAHRKHFGFYDPGNTVGVEEVVMNAFRTTRDAIRDRFRALYEKELRAHGRG